MYVREKIMIRWKLKGCPRCSGDLNVIRDVLGYYEDCLQCGYHHYYKDGYVDIVKNQSDEKKNDDYEPADRSETRMKEDAL
ncbi:MAG: hypothetical protein JSU58_04810 [Dehalococcoidales bacterium]|nr:MAG: hypothetical protein JSU58_04810 [Dehalococcoidales bacterium]